MDDAEYMIILARWLSKRALIRSNQSRLVGIDYGAGLLSHFTLEGGVFSHAIESVTPDAICAQAFSVAARNACASLAAAAVRHADRSWNAIQTSHRYRLVPIVEYTTTISTNTTNTIARITVLFMSVSRRLVM